MMVGRSIACCYRRWWWWCYRLHYNDNNNNNNKSQLHEKYLIGFDDVANWCRVSNQSNACSWGSNVISRTRTIDCVTPSKPSMYKNRLKFTHFFVASFNWTDWNLWVAINGHRLAVGDQLIIVDISQHFEPTTNRQLANWRMEFQLILYIFFDWEKWPIWWRKICWFTFAIAVSTRRWRWRRSLIFVRGALWWRCWMRTRHAQLKIRIKYFDRCVISQRHRCYTPKKN